jgi:hypothetical protein
MLLVTELFQLAHRLLDGCHIRMLGELKQAFCYFYYAKLYLNHSNLLHKVERMDYTGRYILVVRLIYIRKMRIFPRSLEKRKKIRK